MTEQLPRPKLPVTLIFQTRVIQSNVLKIEPLFELKHILVSPLSTRLPDDDDALTERQTKAESLVFWRRKLLKTLRWRGMEDEAIRF